MKIMTIIGRRRLGLTIDNRFHIIIVLILFGNISTLHEEENEKLIWNEGSLLNSTDFKMNPRKDTINFFACAVSSTSISVNSNIEYNDKEVIIKLMVEAVFYPLQSWIWPIEDSNARVCDGDFDILLKHEQKHFDITEIYARKLRKSILHCKLDDNFQEKIRSLQDSINVLWKEENLKYDYETGYSNIIEGQNFWNQKISNDLLLLNDYKNKDLIIRLNNKME